MGVIILPGSFIAVAVSIWVAAKRRITMLRIGFVNFGTRGATKLTAIFIGMMVAGLGAFFAFTLFQGGPSPWRDIVFQNGLIITGIGSLAVCVLFGYSIGLKRLYGYGMLALIALVIGHFAGIFFAYILIALGATVVVTGVALLVSFVRKYPLQGDKAIVD